MTREAAADGMGGLSGFSRSRTCKLQDHATEVMKRSVCSAISGASWSSVAT